MFKNLTFNQYFFWLTLGYAFVIPNTVAGISLFQGLMLISFLFYLPRIDKKEAIESLKKAKPIIALLIFILVSFISILWSDNKAFALEYISKYQGLLILPVMYLMLDVTRIRHVFSAFLVGMMFSELITLGIFFEFFQFDNIAPSDPSPFMNHTDFSLYLALTSVLILTRIDLSQTRTLKAIYTLSLTLTFFCILIVGGRTGQVIFMIIFPVYLYLNFKEKIKFVSIALFAFILLFLFSYISFPSFQNRLAHTLLDINKSITEENYSNSFGQRVSLWRVGSGIYLNHFPFGTGIGDERTGIKEQLDRLGLDKLVHSKYEDIETNGYIDFHSTFVQVTVQMGIIGLLAFLYFFYSIYKIKLITKRYINVKIVFIICIILYGAANNLLHTVFPMTFTSFFLAILLARSRDEEKNII